MVDFADLNDPGEMLMYGAADKVQFREQLEEERRRQEQEREKSSREDHDGNGAPQSFDTAQWLSKLCYLADLPPPAAISPRPWIIKRLLLRRALTLLVRRGGVGKSTMALQLAISCALGLPFMGFPIVGGKPLRVALFNNEDDLDELNRRIAAVCVRFGIDYASTARQFVYRSGVSDPL